MMADFSRNHKERLSRQCTVSQVTMTDAAGTESFGDALTTEPRIKDSTKCAEFCAFERFYPTTRASVRCATPSAVLPTPTSQWWHRSTFILLGQQEMERAGALQLTL